MKFTTILFSLAIIVTTNDNGVHCMEDHDDMDNITDTTAFASSNEGDELAAWEDLDDIDTAVLCAIDVTNMYDGNDALAGAWKVWYKSLTVDEGLSTEGGNSSYSYTSAYYPDATAALKEECEKVDGNTWTPKPDRSFQCRQIETYEEDMKWQDVTVAVSNNGVCLPDSENCNNSMNDTHITATDFVDQGLYTKLWEDQSIKCSETDEIPIIFRNYSGGVVTSTTFIGSLVVTTAVLAFTVLI